VGTTHSAPPPSDGSSPSSRSRSGSRLEEQRGRQKRTPSPQERGAAVGKASPVAPRRRRQGRGGCYRARCGYCSRPDRGGGDRDGSNSAPVSMEEAATVAVRPLLFASPSPSTTSSRTTSTGRAASNGRSTSSFRGSTVAVDPSRGATSTRAAQTDPVPARKGTTVGKASAKKGMTDGEESFGTPSFRGSTVDVDPSRGATSTGAAQTDPVPARKGTAVGKASPVAPRWRWQGRG
jgi:hypothetical protein